MCSKARARYAAPRPTRSRGRSTCCAPPAPARSSSLRHDRGCDPRITSRHSGQLIARPPEVAVPVLGTSVDPSSETYQANRAALLELIGEHNEQVALAIAGGGERYQARHRARGKLLARERIELLVDRDSPFLEFSPLAAWGTEFNVGAVIDR